MENILIDKTIDTPYVRFEPGYIEIEGRSIPENVHNFYHPLYLWVEEYIKKPEKFTKITISIEYTNSSSTKYINDIIQMLGTAYNEKHDMKVFWKYEEDDETILQIGEDLSSILDIPFKFIEYEEIRKQIDKIKVKRIETGEIITITHRFWETIKRNGHEDEYIILEQYVDED